MPPTVDIFWGFAIINKEDTLYKGERYGEEAKDDCADCALLKEARDGKLGVAT